MEANIFHTSPELTSVFKRKPNLMLFKPLSGLKTFMESLASTTCPEERVETRPIHLPSGAFPPHLESLLPSTSDTQLRPSLTQALAFPPWFCRLCSLCWNAFFLPGQYLSMLQDLCQRKAIPTSHAGHGPSWTHTLSYTPLATLDIVISSSHN